jgi:hypothetical protein
MRSQPIPAQITTVEDKIAGNLNLTQIMLLMVPVFFTTAAYAIFPPKMQLAMYKLPLVFLVLIICLILSMRIKGKVVLNWLVILLRYNIRPSYYMFNKNDVYLRTLDMPVFEKKQRRLFKKAPAKQEKKAQVPTFALHDLVKFQRVINDPNYSFVLKAGKKGGFNVSVGQIQK